ncbi:hypothetical protein PInf_027989 [Phytophthora infestans]|nr:hypothetical protein PInf_027989 [Phytophthora infestans]
MKCAFINCVNHALSQTDPCSVRDIEAQDLCSNDLHSPGNLSVRRATLKVIFDACVAAWKTKNPPPKAMPFTKDQLGAFDAAGWSPGAPHQQDSQSSIPESETLELSCSQSSEETTPPGSQVHTSNAKDHMVAMHSTHRVGKEEMAKRTKRARRQIDSALSNVSRCLSQRIADMPPPEAKMTKRGAPQKLWSPTQKELNVHIARWLIKDIKLLCLPYNTVVTDDFRNLVHLLTGNASATILSSGTYGNMLEALFAWFCTMAAKMLKDEFKAAFGLPFLNVLLDSSTTGSGKKKVCLALLVTVHNGSHESCKVKPLITSRIEKFYGIAIEEMAQFSMPDTTPSAKKVSKLFEDSTPTDCGMHVLNLCLLYGMGMRENTETVYMVDPETNLQKKEH